MSLPTFDVMRRRAHRLLGAADAELRSDWRPGHGPTPAQAEAIRTALDLIARARGHLDLAARLADAGQPAEWTPGDPSRSPYNRDPLPPNGGRP